MYFANTYEVDDHVRRFADDHVLGAAAITLQNLRDWTDRNSDGWAYWPKPTRAAARLMRLLDLVTRQERSSLANLNEYGHLSVNPADVRKAYVPIRAFLTRQGVDSKTIIVEVYA